jgi:hypothetical protein
MTSRYDVRAVCALLPRGPSAHLTTDAGAAPSVNRWEAWRRRLNPYEACPVSR